MAEPIVERSVARAFISYQITRDSKHFRAIKSFFRSAQPIGFSKERFSSKSFRNGKLSLDPCLRLQGKSVHSRSVNEKCHNINDQAQLRARALGITLPPPYRFRPIDSEGRRQSAVDYFEAHWRALGQAVQLYSDDLRLFDRPLYDALASALRYDNKTLADLLPSSPTRGKKPELRTVEDRIANMLLQRAERARRYRQRKAEKRSQSQSADMQSLPKPLKPLIKSPASRPLKGKSPRA